MYLSFYGLKIKPFQNSTNPSFFWLGEKQKEALAILKYGLSKMPGILLLTGDAGTGKTTFSNVFLNSLDDQFIVVKFPDPDMEGIDFMNYLADALDFKTNFSSIDAFFTHFSRFLDTSSSLGKKVILVIDECQRLDSHLLQEIIKLANIEKDGTKLLKVLLIGQNEFDAVLKKNTSRTLHELIAINYAIEPLDLHETGEFIRHRLKIAGANRDIFSPDAITKIYQFSTGIPCVINIMCDHALLHGYGQESKTINGELIRECAGDLRPREFFYSPPNEMPISSAGDNSLIIRPPPESRLKNAAPWQGKTLGRVVMLMIPVFLITYFTDPTTFVKNPRRVEPQNRTQTSDSAMHKGSTENTDTLKIAPLPTISVTKDEPKTPPSVIKPADQKIDTDIVPENELQSQELVDEQVETTGKVTIDQTANQENHDALPDSTRISSTAEETPEAVTEPPENIDPGAVIDWVLKNRPK